MRSRPPITPPKLVYVLSGGGLKGFCHIGMLEALEGRGLRPDLIVGTSAGALVGALYSHFGSVAGLRARLDEALVCGEFLAFKAKYLPGREPGTQPEEGRIRRYLSGLSDSVLSTARMTARFGRSLLTSAMIGEEEANALFRLVLSGLSFETLGIPFGAVAVDLELGRPVILDSPKASPGTEGLMRAVMASCAIPLVFPAVRIGGRDLADGGIMANLPVREAKVLLGGARAVVVGLDVSQALAEPEGDLSSVDLCLRLLDLATRSKQEADRELVDVLLSGLGGTDAHFTFDDREDLVGLGRACVTEGKLADIEALLRVGQSQGLWEKLRPSWASLRARIGKARMLP